VGGRLAILWHLHQPDYRDPVSGRPVLPWTRLHALRGYRDLLLEVVEHGLPWTLNVVPLLADQLGYYAAGGDDRHLELARREASSLDPAEIDEAAATLPGGHPAMTRAHPAWEELRGRIAAGAHLDVAALRDLQVWSTLAWFGATARRDFPVLGALIDKGRRFDEDDKRAMFTAHDAVLADLPRRLRSAAHAPGPALSTSPYFHPILPLLIDARHAAQSLAGAPEVSFAYADDARWHLRAARDRMEQLTGRRPIGLWPSEGAVSPEVVALAAEAGFAWLATDDGVLARSDHTAAAVPGGWDLGHGVRGFFRDHVLSDRIGFRYATWPAAEAARDLAAAARERAAGGVLLVALDGENPWESFPDAGGAFREALRRAVPAAGLRWITLDEATEEAPVGGVRRLHIGSWVNADLRIWIGHEEDRAAWRMLAAARDAAALASPERREAAMVHLRAAEGSDWTWWFGDEFRTPSVAAFDRIYRDHLSAAWRALGREPPPELSRPIAALVPPAHRPADRWLAIDPGHAGTWIGWAGAGTLRDADAVSMARGSAPSSVEYGWTPGPDLRPDALWVRVLGSGSWRLARPADGWTARPVPGGVVFRIAGSDPVDVQLAAADGATWPGEPVRLAPPVHPALAWWDV